MGFCSLPPDIVKLAVNSKKKQTAGSKWAKGQDGLLFSLPPEKTNSRVKMCCCCLPPDRAKLTDSKKETKKQRVGSNWAKRSQVGPGPF